MFTYNGWHFPDLDTHFKNSVGDYPNTSYQQATIDLAYKYVKNVNLSIDIGANIGLHSVRFASKFSSVYSFEPVATNFECLKCNTNIFKNIKCINKGIGSKCETQKIKIPNGSVNCGAYSIVDFEDFENTIDEEIQIVTLDEYNLSPDLIKIDTQGFEEYVLLGAVETLKKHNCVIITEIESKKQRVSITNILTNLGYRLKENYRKDYIWSKA